MRTALKFVLAAGLAGVALSPLAGADWPHWRGPAGTGISAEKGLLATWPKAGPKHLWTSNAAGTGYAGLAVVGGTVYTMGVIGNDEHAIAIAPDGKKQLWSTKIGPILLGSTNQWSRGPTATPTVDGDLVYCLGSKGDLLCCDKATGKKVWSQNLPTLYSAEVNAVGGGIAKFGWGFSWSPLVDGDKLVLTPGGPKGLFAALDKKTGKLLWQSKAVTAQSTYSTMTIATIGGVKQYIAMTQNGVVAVSAADGSPLWNWKRDDDYPDVVCPTPIVKDNHVYASVGAGGGAVLLEITGKDKSFTAKPLYEEKTISNRQGGLVLVDKYVYGYQEDRAWACVDLMTGQQPAGWKSRTRQGIKAGGILEADGKLYVLDEQGTVGLLAASPAGYKVLGSFELPQKSANRPVSGKVWTHPSLSDGKLYLRDQELVYCYEVK